MKRKTYTLYLSREEYGVILDALILALLDAKTKRVYI